MAKSMNVLGLLAGLFLLAMLCFTAAHAEAGPEQRIVVFRAETAPQQRVAIAEAAGGKLVRELRFINAVVVSLPASQMQAAEAKLRARSEVLRIDEDPRVNWIAGRLLTDFRGGTSAPYGAVAGALAEPSFPDARAIVKPFVLTGRPAAAGTQELPWGVKRVNAPAAWATTRGAGVKVAVIDTGIDYDHPELKGVIAGGWNATNKENPADFKDDNGHGSHCSGIIAAADNEEGVVGVAPAVSLYGVKVLDKNGSGTFSDVIAGMEWTIDNKMQVASMSLGANKGNDSLKAAVEAMVKGGVVVIAAAGNSGSTVGFPAAYPGCIAVAASDAGDKVASFSSRGPEVDLIAPGVNVPSTYMGGGYEKLSGTSMACPHVSGLAALAIAAKKLSGDKEVRAALTAAAKPFSGVPAAQQGAGLVDAGKLVK